MAGCRGDLRAIRRGDRGQPMAILGCGRTRPIGLATTDPPTHGDTEGQQHGRGFERPATQRAPWHAPGLSVMRTAPSFPVPSGSLRARLNPGHIDKAAVMTLECDSHRGGRAITMLCQNEVCLTRTGRLPLICILAVQKYHDIRILLN